MDPKPPFVTYEIRTLADIFKLPTPDAMERCLNELSEMMVSSRAYSEMIVACAKDVAERDGRTFPADTGFTWPASVKWTDDGGIVGSEILFTTPDGKPFSTLAFKKTGA